jgi:hypothetical protein
VSSAAMASLKKAALISLFLVFSSPYSSAILQVAHSPCSVDTSAVIEGTFVVVTRRELLGGRQQGYSLNCATHST